VTVRNNSLTSNTFGIYLDDSATVASIIYNNIQDSKQNNLVLDDVPTNVNAAYNWWGTTDNQAINQTIYDYKNDFYLGNVNYVPLLTQPNPEAPSTQITVIPEFPAWILLPLFFVATFVVLVVRRRLVC
jgi:parallel beta-helix repeat protein